jgi:hypothetical protein
MLIFAVSGGSKDEFSKDYVIHLHTPTKRLLLTPPGADYMDVARLLIDHCSHAVVIVGYTGEIFPPDLPASPENLERLVGCGEKVSRRLAWWGVLQLLIGLCILAPAVGLIAYCLWASLYREAILAALLGMPGIVFIRWGLGLWRRAGRLIRWTRQMEAGLGEGGTWDDRLKAREDF